MDRTISLLAGYDGTEFHGWQRQGQLRTVQGVIEESLRRVVRHPVELIGSGRTDAGVHAAGHVSSFVTVRDLPPEKLCDAIGARLPGDVAILAAREMHADFHATRSALRKLYRYRVYNAGHRPVERGAQRYAYHFRHPLDVDSMRSAARHFVGEMDFSAVAAAGSTRCSMIRTVFRCDVYRHLDEVRIDVEGDGFLYRQVRIMVGTLLNVGRGRWEPDDVATILESRDRANAGPTARAHGLCLRWVRYPEHLFVPPGAAGPNPCPLGPGQSESRGLKPTDQPPNSTGGAAR